MGPGSHEQCQEEEEEETHRFLSTTMLLREMSSMICQRPCTHTDGHPGYGSQPATTARFQWMVAHAVSQTTSAVTGQPPVVCLSACGLPALWLPS